MLQTAELIGRHLKFAMLTHCGGSHSFSVLLDLNYCREGGRAVFLLSLPEHDSKRH